MLGFRFLCMGVREDLLIVFRLSRELEVMIFSRFHRGKRVRDL